MARGLRASMGEAIEVSLGDCDHGERSSTGRLRGAVSDHDRQVFTTRVMKSRMLIRRVLS